MRNIKLLLVFFLLLWVTDAEAFTFVTPLGITIKATKVTVDQYNSHWACWDGPVFPRRPTGQPDKKLYRIGPKWENIDWTQIDRMFTELSHKYHSYPNPKYLTIIIYPINYGCHDESSYPYSYEFSYPDYGCIDGIYPSRNIIVIHLGDDPGQLWDYSLNQPFCATALDWEFFHYFLYWIDDECWDEEFNPACLAKYRAPSELCY